ncbi:SusC/RagA family TonB-linked outer membrane protein [Mucilaginibacter sp. BJC16-A38]|uniref:SusC/RagA family TonB-linked outer membrane protein n=1 Tax=Mucilaginibacter phenanthrenivorans TaxID=1234842 RepID=UPI002157A9ED|nr:SusC/RagA family TonB-linked outer membrane protein [Mucilaginibacter phenanthrenivorans]MCR8558918.1 SusC/RagA family TonB-linked outer membrane protein [Mucilaginibacter phenanthrenivorans]
MKKLYTLVAFLLGCFMYASAQNVTVKGTVTDDHNQPLPGVNVKVAGTTNGTSTSVDGAFSISAPANSSLVFSYIGYVSQTVKVGGKTVINITLKDDQHVLETVTVTALGIEQKTKTLTYATQNVSGDELNKVKDDNFINSLAGKAAGVVVTKGTGGPGSPTRVEIRGQKSIGGNSAPLYVIDGIPIGQASGGSMTGFGGGDSPDPLSQINPDDIASTEILKGAAAAALYGSSAANGAILITTKKGKAGQTRIDFNSSTSFENPISLPTTQTQYGRTVATQNDMWGAKVSNGSDAFIKDFFNTGKSYINGVTVSGGSDIATFYASYANTRATGIVPNNSLTKHNFTVKGLAKFFKGKLTVDGSVNYINQKQENPPRAGFYMSPIFSLYLFPTDDNFNNYGKVGNKYETFNSVRGLYDQNWPYERNEASTNQNPYWIQYKDLDENFTARSISSFRAKYDFTSWLNIQVRTTLDQYNYKNTVKNAAGTDNIDVGDGGNFTGTYGVYTGFGTHLYSDVLLSASGKVSKDFSLSGTLGLSDDRTYDYSEGFSSSNSFGMLFPNFFSINNFDSAHPFNYGESESKGISQAAFGTATVGFKETVYLDVTARNEWAYTSPQAFFYPSVGLSYILTNTIGTSNVLTFAKIRASYAEVGAPLGQGINNTDPPYSINHTTGSTDPRNTLPYFSGSTQAIIKPERTKSTEVGATVTLFNKLNIDLTYYDARSNDQIITIQAPTASGAQNFVLNGGEIRNFGFEGTIGYHADFGNLKWNPSINFSHNKNQVRQLSPLYTADRYVVSSSDNSRLVASFLTKPVNGKYGSFGDLYGRVIEKNADGSVKVDDQGLPVLSDVDQTYVGNPNPKFLLGFNNNFNYKAFNLSFLIDSRFGGDAYSLTQAWFDYKGMSQRTADARNAGGVDVNGKKVDAQAYYGRISGGGNYPAVEEYRYSATNIRLRELAFGYTFPLVGGVFKNLNVSVIGRNLFFFHKDAPFDPEQAISTGTNVQGIDSFGLPATRSFGFSLKTTL